MAAASNAPPDVEPETPILSGPQIADSISRTLVNRDMQGRLQRLQGRPEDAAFALMQLEPDRREAIRQASAARRERLGMLLVDHIDLIKQTTDAIAAEDRETIRANTQTIYDAFDPDHERDPVLIEVEALLTADERTEAVRLLDEYWHALIDWELRRQPDADEAQRDAVQQRLQFGLFQQELRQAYEWSLRPFRARLETIYEIAQPTDEQRAAIRHAMIDYIRDSRLEPTADLQQQTARRIYELLDEAQRRRLFEHALWRM